MAIAPAPEHAANRPLYWDGCHDCLTVASGYFLCAGYRDVLDGSHDPR